MFKDLLLYFENQINNETKTNTFNKEYRLDRVKSLLNLLDNPQNKVKAFHITGSKGKGTCTSIIQSCLTSLGYKVGTFTSPHVFSYRERFKIDGKICDEKVYDKVSDKFYNIVKDFKHTDNSKATTFELFTCFAFYFFYENKCDYNVIEVGLGGRLDATNVLTSSIAMLTSIEKEHTNVLGNTTEKITFEKASISKNNLFVSLLDKSCYKVCQEVGKNPLFLESDLISYDSSFINNKHLVTLVFKDSKYILNAKLIGKVNALNIAFCIWVLKKNNLFNDSCLKAIENTTLLGRFSKISENPVIIIDSSHTQKSIQACFDNIKMIYPDKKIISIFTLIKGKDYKNICPIVEKESSDVILCKPSSFKESELDVLSTYFKSCYSFDTIDQSYEKAINLLDSSSIILCCGSFYLISLLYKKIIGDEYEL